MAELMICETCKIAMGYKEDLFVGKVSQRFICVECHVRMTEVENECPECNLPENECECD